MKRFLIFIIAIALVFVIQAQTPQGIPFQAAARNANGNILANTAISVRFTIHDSTANGVTVYQETQNATTTQQGMFGLNMGMGTPVNGTFAGINWGNNAKFMQVELSTNSGSSYTDMGTTQMMSVPYALYAKTAESSNNISNGTANNQMLYWNGSSWVNLNPGTNGQVLTMCNGTLTWTTGGQCPGIISSLNCASAINNGTLYTGTNASGVSSNIPYTGVSSGPYNSQTVNSTGVMGLTATIAAGNITLGSSSLTYDISGIPASSGTASFVLNIGGQICTLTRVVSNQPTYPTGTVICTSTPTAIIDVTNPTTGKIWMDRNLGASQVATSISDVASYGDLYQWGRRSDGHQCRTSATTSTLSSTDQPAHGNFIIPPTQIVGGINYGTVDWRAPSNYNLWQGVNGINNPCPSGYRIPTKTELDLEYTSWSSQDSYGALASPLKLPSAGYRNYTDGSLYVGIAGFYWSSSINWVYMAPSTLAFAPAGISGGNSFIQSYGLPVRCIKD